MTMEETNELKTITGALLATMFKDQVTETRKNIDLMTNYLCDVLEKNNVNAPFGEIKDAVIDCVGHILRFPDISKT